MSKELDALMSLMQLLGSRIDNLDKWSELCEEKTDLIFKYCEGLKSMFDDLHDIVKIQDEQLKLQQAQINELKELLKLKTE